MIVLEAVLIFRPMVNKVRQYSFQLELLASNDPLTGVYNRRRFYQRFGEEFERAKRYRDPLSLLIIDLDHFKKANDTYGHPAGDAVLKSVADLVGSSIRSVDCFGRIGGEGFCVLFPSTALDEAFTATAKIHKLLQETSIKIPGKNGEEVISVTASFGLAELDLLKDGNPGDLYARADETLYRAKHAGRNQVSTAA